MEELDLKELFNYFLSKITIITLIILFSVLGSCIYQLYIQKPLYSSYTTIVLTRSSESNNETAITQNDITINQKLVSTYREIMKSHRVLNQVINNLKLKTTADELSKKITLTNEKDTELIKISVSDEDSSQARDIANEIASVFSNEIIDIYNIKNVNVIDYAEQSISPYNVNFLKQTLIAIIFGVVVSFGFVFVVYYFDTTIKSVEEVEKKLGLPILGAVPTSQSRRGGKK